MTVVDGSSGIVAAEVAPLADAFAEIATEEAPASLVVRRGSTTLLDVASGKDRAGTLFTTSTPVLLASAIKPAVALAALIAVADGALDLDDLVATHWPAFGAHGKGSVTVRHVLAHAAAVPGWREPFSSTELFDQPVATAALAASPRGGRREIPASTQPPTAISSMACSVTRPDGACRRGGRR